MPNHTANFNLPYPASTDEPCDFAQQWCDFTEAVDVVLAGFQKTLDRVYPAIPIAVLWLSQQVVATSGGLLPYDAVAIDTPGWTQVDVNNTMISPDMAGVLTLSSNAQFHWQNGPGAFALIPDDVLGTGLTLFHGQELDTNVVPVGIDVEQPMFISSGVWVPGVSGFANVILISSAPATMTVMTANFAIYWHSDGGTV